MSRRTGFATACAAVAVLVFAGQSLAATWNFSWSGWKGGSRDSRTWNARSGNQQWVKESCRANAYRLSGGHFGVEIRRVRRFLPDVSLGTRNFYCSNKNAAATYFSRAGGNHKFRFPYVDRGAVGISGAGRVNYRR